ncbi:hypothetical protein PAU_01689 [Photorhabdus asymbiotica]|uniref:Uncharacterized protein n=1 Tax=Photorhabdus asymbiotica subsp. asymbiotica (strain ATCC 43949 / 3105-77) TaxID=553480 RepID=C7BST7_PHOAA|nr:hypothetical protein PAU_01689 [Photorhabdus asymbiotica]
MKKNNGTKFGTVFFAIVSSFAAIMQKKDLRKENSDAACR